MINKKKLIAPQFPKWRTIERRPKANMKFPAIICFIIMLTATEQLTTILTYKNTFLFSLVSAKLQHLELTAESFMALHQPSPASFSSLLQQRVSCSLAMLHTESVTQQAPFSSFSIIRFYLTQKMWQAEAPNKVRNYLLVDCSKIVLHIDKDSNAFFKNRFS